MAWTLPTDLASVIVNISHSMPAVLTLVTATSYTIGLFMLFNSVYKLKQYGDLRTMSSSNTDVRGPLVTLGVGTLLLFIPSTFNLANSTIFGYTGVLAYQPAGDQSFDQIMESVVLIIQVVGAISFIRGLLHLSKAGQGQGQPGTLGKGFTHVIAGILGINVVATWEIIEATLGIASN